jgi:hypothetical protein
MAKPGPLLTHIEERFVFRMSRTVWLLVVAVAFLAMVGGVTVLTWSAVPAGKREVTKAEYPASVTVTLEDVKEAIKPTPKPVATAAAKTTAEPTKAAAVDPDRQAFDKAMARLKVLFPASQYAWEDVTGWDYPYGEESWELSNHDPLYRNRVVYQTGIRSQLQEWLKQPEAATLSELAKILDAFAVVLAHRPVSERRDLLADLGRVVAATVDESVGDILGVGAIIAPLPGQHLRYASRAADFLVQHSTAAAGALSYYGEVTARFEKPERTKTLDILFASYVSRFGSSVDEARTLLDGFLPMLPKVPKTSQAKALNAYLDLHARKSGDRTAAVREIDERFRQASVAAEAEFETARAAKTSSRPLALYAVAGGIGLTAMVALLLVLLSIQRYLKTIADRLGDGEFPVVQTIVAAAPARKAVPTRRPLMPAALAESEADA